MMTKKNFIHAFGSNDKTKKQNLFSTRTLSSLLQLDLFCEINVGNRICGENPMHMDLNILKTNPLQNLKNYPVSQRLTTVILGAEYRKKKVRSVEEEDLVKWADIELAFEEKRRSTPNFPPSRLSALYLAEDSESGIANIKQMFNGLSIFRVEILNEYQIHKADVRWYEEYGNCYEVQYISNYWAGVPYDNENPRWEYLLEGTISFIEQIE